MPTDLDALFLVTSILNVYKDLPLGFSILFHLIILRFVLYCFYDCSFVYYMVSGASSLSFQNVSLLSYNNFSQVDFRLDVSAFYFFISIFYFFSTWAF